MKLSRDSVLLLKTLASATGEGRGCHPPALNDCCEWLFKNDSEDVCPSCQSGLSLDLLIGFRLPSLAAPGLHARKVCAWARDWVPGRETTESWRTELRA